MPGLRAIFAGGGTGGHLFPAIAVADELKKLDLGAEILFVGTKDKIEARVVPQCGYAFRTIWISGFHRSFRLGNFLFPLKVVISFMQARSIIQKFKPDVVIGTGGYVSGPVLRAAVSMKIPTLIQEQNSYPGVTTRMLADRVDELHLTFESSKKYFSQKDRVFVSGNPTRNTLENADTEKASAYFGFDQAQNIKTLFVVGGSLGARSINEAVRLHLDELIKDGFRILWQTGKEYFPEASAAAKKYSSNMISVHQFIDRMDYAYAVADLVVCRAGATTLAELTRLGKPAILVPYPHAAANHQVENARAMTESGAAEILYDAEVSERLLQCVLAVSEDKRLLQMSEQSRALGKPNAARDIAE
ncbi:MAG TPA: undecaprenyldiphospho-muramoylpentapeptide beta-N-acetylglucosaminyltransferase, partial [Bacteroidota bacterium]|nr:undecaprenyldiphospho-muramoylpentapeptide beta-N-acetylglucosaminyltransferase [Bacteroidota bacterium]